MSINFAQFPTPTLPVNSADFVVGYQLAGTGGVPTLAQYTLLQLAGIIGPLIGNLPPSGPAGGDLSGAYPNPTVASVHATSGTLDNVTVGGVTPAAAAFTTLVVGGAVSGPGFNTFARTTNPLSQFASTTSAQLAGVISDETGTGALVFANSPTLNSPAMGNPTATTQAAHNNTTLVASTQFVETEFASPPPAGVGSVTPSPGFFTTLNSTGAYTPSQTAGIVGTTTNNNANAGSVGEFVSATAAAAGVTTNVQSNVTSVSLTAGDWDVQGEVGWVPGGTTTATQFTLGLSTTSVTLPGVGTGTRSTLSATSTGQLQELPTPVWRISLAVTTTVFLVQLSTFAGTCTAQGFLRARRVR